MRPSSSGSEDDAAATVAAAAATMPSSTPLMMSLSSTSTSFSPSSAALPHGKSADPGYHHPANPSHHHPSNAPTTFFFRREEDLDERSASASYTATSSRSSSSSSSASLSSSMAVTDRARDSTYGVQSLEDALEAADTHATTTTAAAADAAADGEDDGRSEVSYSSMARGSRHARAGVEDAASPRARILAAKVRERRGSGSGSGSGATTTAAAALASSKLQRHLTPLNLEAVSRLGGVSSGTTRSESRSGSMSLRSYAEEDEMGSEAEAGSQVLMDSEDEEGPAEEERRQGVEGRNDPTPLGSEGFPQLVMPSIQMPSRRPFTDRGRGMGRLKVLVAGSEGAGKTSLIKAIVRTCEDIVHVDPLAQINPAVSTTSLPPRGKLSRKGSSQPTKAVTEIHASTKPYPEWWADLEESKVLKRRRSAGDAVLERNLCFVDTPGDAETVVSYVESLLHRNAAVAVMSDSELMTLFGGGGGVQVDVVLYLLVNGNDLAKDMECLRRLSALTNVIPLIGKADTLTGQQIIQMKETVLRNLLSRSVKPFLFGKSMDDSLCTAQNLANQDPARHETEHAESTQIQDLIPPFAISSRPASDSESVDSSILMSSDYVQPAIPSELPALVARLFDPSSIDWLRHSAAKKFLQWRLQQNATGPGNSTSANRFGMSSEMPGRGQHIYHSAASTVASSILSSPSPSQVLVPQAHSPFYASHFSSPSIASASHHIETADLPEYTLARLRDHTQREERLAQVRLARWAADLQRSLRNERHRFEELQKGERARWLLERVGDEVKEGNVIASPTSGSSFPAASAGGKDWALIRTAEKAPSRHREPERHWSGFPKHPYGPASCRRGRDPRDPLGLVELGDGFRRGGLVVLQVLGGVGVLGALAMVVVRLTGAGSAGMETAASYPSYSTGPGGAGEGGASSFGTGWLGWFGWD